MDWVQIYTVYLIGSITTILTILIAKDDKSAAGGFSLMLIPFIPLIGRVLGGW